MKMWAKMEEVREFLSYGRSKVIPNERPLEREFSESEWRNYFLGMDPQDFLFLEVVTPFILGPQFPFSFLGHDSWPKKSKGNGPRHDFPAQPRTCGWDLGTHVSFSFLWLLSHSLKE